MSSCGKPVKQIIPTVLAYILMCLVLVSGCGKEGIEPCGFEETPAGERKQHKILFIGNSLTFTQNIPDQVSSLATSKGDSAFTLMAKDPSMELFSNDGVHATPEGAYLTACTIYSMLFLRSPVSAYGPSEIPGSELVSIQNTVYQTLFRCNPDWTKF